MKNTFNFGRFSALAVTGLVLLGSGCSSKKTVKGRPQVVTSIFPVFELTRVIAGPDADVSVLLPPGHNEHHFDPTPKDIATASKASLMVMVGLGLDPWVEKLAKDATSQAKVLRLGDTVAVRSMPTSLGEEEAHDGDDDDDDDHEHGKHDKGGKHTDHKHTERNEQEHKHGAHHHGAKDPHVWLDPKRVKTMVHAISEALAQNDPPHAEGYRSREAAFVKEVDALDAEAETRLNKLKRRSFVTFHGSFGYFAERYRLEILAVIEPYPGSQPSSAYLRKVMGVIKDKSVPALFSEPQLDPRAAKVLADEAKIPLGVLDPVGGGPDTDSYAKLIRFNVAALEKNLGQ
jgi:zinc transport system substrate-binding protein